MIDRCRDLSHPRDVLLLKMRTVAQAQEIKDVRDVLKEPLTGKQVMVPMTTKAFFAGRLEPAVRNKQEQVFVKMAQEHFVELDRTEAMDYLDRRIAALEEQTHLATAPAADRAGEKISQGQASSALPFFEIREELDQEGREVRAEAINVAKELAYLQKKESEGKPASSLVPTTAAMSHEEPLDDEPERMKGLTDDDYDALSARLEELARLEEESEQTKIVNQASSRKLQSKGWAKGFLNADSNPKTKARAQGTKKEIPSSPKSSNQKGKKVDFHETNHVREIPRIGERSAAELKQAVRKGIEPEVFSGVIRERPMGQQAARPTPTATAPPKKLSRFAQERQEQR